MGGEMNEKIRGRVPCRRDGGKKQAGLNELKAAKAIRKGVRELSRGLIAMLQPPSKKGSYGATSMGV